MRQVANGGFRGRLLCMYGVVIALMSRPERMEHGLPGACAFRLEDQKVFEVIGNDLSEAVWFW